MGELLESNDRVRNIQTGADVRIRQNAGILYHGATVHFTMMLKSAAARDDGIRSNLGTRTYEARRQQPSSAVDSRLVNYPNSRLNFVSCGPKIATHEKSVLRQTTQVADVLQRIRITER